MTLSRFFQMRRGDAILRAASMEEGARYMKQRQKVFWIAVGVAMIALLVAAYGILFMSAVMRER